MQPAIKAELIIDEHAGLCRATLVRNRRMIDLAVDRMDSPRLYQSIWRAKADRAVPKLGTFVKLGPHDGLLRDVQLAGGTKLIVQIKSLRSEGKAQVLTRDIAITGRYFIYLPQENRIAVSRSLKTSITFAPLLEELAQNGIHGGIVRTAACSVATEAIVQEALAMQGRWQAIATSTPADDLLLEGPDAARRLEADHGALQITRADAGFDDYGLDVAFSVLLDTTIPLPGGGSIIIQPTSALVAIDVNAGTRPPMDANRDAVMRIAEQIRLRNLSGLILIDFAAVKPRDALEGLANQLAGLTESDPAGCRVGGLTPAGLVEMTRQRRTLPLHEMLERTITEGARLDR